MKTRGFTLLELMVTVAIAILMMGIGVPSMNSLFQSLASEASSNRLMREVQFARTQAINLGQRVVICALDTDNSTCGGVVQDGLTIFLDANNNGQFDATETALKTAEPYSTAGTVNFRGSIDSLTFGSDGLISGNSGSLFFCSHNSDYVNGVIVSRGGSARFPTATESSSCPI